MEKSEIEKERKKQLKAVGESVRMEMHRQKLTVVELSEKSGISRPTIIKIIKGENYNISNLLDVCIALHVKPFIIIKNETI